jgi:diamine N-acetyltransferase
MELRGARIVIRPLRLEDVFYMRNWGHHENPLFSDYNFPEMDDNGIRDWFSYKTSSIFNKYYGVCNKENHLIGYIGIKGINLLLKKSTLGIVFDPNHIDKGYGTEALKLYLGYYFTEMKMKTMHLEVTEYNQRAYHCYRKLGFKVEGYYLDDFHDQDLDLTNKYYLEAQSSFVIVNKKIYNYIYKMMLDREDFFRLIEG